AGAQQRETVRPRVPGALRAVPPRRRDRATATQHVHGLFAATDPRVRVTKRSEGVQGQRLVAERFGSSERVAAPLDLRRDVAGLAAYPRELVERGGDTVVRSSGDERRHRRFRFGFGRREVAGTRRKERGESHVYRAALARLGPKSEQLPQCLDAHGVLAGLRALPTDLVEHRRTIDRPARYETPQRGEVLQSLAVSLRPLRLSCRGPDELDRRLVTRQCASYRVIRPDLERLSDEHP